MAFRQLPPFERGVELDAVSARQDKIDASFGDWTFIGDPELFWGAMHHLQESTYEVVMPSGLIEERPVFGAIQGLYTGRFSIPISADQSQYGSLLFNGKLVGTRRTGDDRNRPTFSLSFQLQLNPTRALNHQPLHPEIRAGRSPTGTPALHTTRRVVPRSRVEIALDGKDNVVLGRRQMLMQRHEHWRTYRDMYLGWVEQFLSSLIDRTIGTADGHFAREPGFNLRAVETYFEFQHDDPIHVVAGMEPLFRSLGTDSSTRIYANVLRHTDYQHHSPVHTCRLVRGVSAKVYAKTTRRIRLEITHDLTSSDRVATSHVRPHLAGLISLLDEVSAHDTGEARSLMQALERAIPPRGQQAPPYELVRAILAADDDLDRQRALLSIIINGGGIRCPNGDALRPAVNALRRDGIIERVRRSRASFLLAERFQRARLVLAGQIDGWDG